MESDSFFDARTCYEDGLQLCAGKDSDIDLHDIFVGRIETANQKLAELNLREAEFAYSRGDIVKAIDHLELVKTLTSDPELREKADSLLLRYEPTNEVQEVHVSSSSCSSCKGSSSSDQPENVHLDDSLPLIEYYELLIQQLPLDQYHRYAELGEHFAGAYVAASRDEHSVALLGFENCVDTLPHDIYWYEKGKVLHRLGKDLEAEKHLRTAIQLNNSNSLAWIVLAHLLRENGRFQDALETVDSMVVNNIFPEQALLLRADIFEATGNHEGAVNLYVELLQTPYSRAAAEKLYGILMEIGRENDAAVIFKKYLNKSCH